MKEKIINKVLNTKKTVPSLFFIITPLIFLMPAFVFLIVLLSSNEIRTNNLKESLEIITVCGSIGIIGVGFAIWFMKFSKKLTAIKIPKDELEYMYDNIITDEVITEMKNSSDELKNTYDNMKKASFKNIIFFGGIIIACCILLFIGISKFNDMLIIAIFLGLCYSINYIIPNIYVSLKSSEKLVEEAEEKFIFNSFFNLIQERNNEIIKENKSIKRKKNTLLFLLIELGLLFWIISILWSVNIFEMINTDGIYVIVLFIPIIGIPAFFLIRNVYVRYIKK